MQWHRYALAQVCAIAIIGGGTLAAAGDRDDHGRDNESRMEVLRGASIMHVKGATHAPATPAQVIYQGGYNGTGVIAGASKVYLVYWGSQWNNNDPSGEAAIQWKFFNDVANSAWNNSMTQYCQGVARGTKYCNGTGTPAINGPTFIDVWYDNTASAPKHPTQSQLAAEAVKAAKHFGNTTQTSNVTAQYVINTARQNNSTGFGSCTARTTARRWRRSGISRTRTCRTSRMPARAAARISTDSVRSRASRSLAATSSPKPRATSGRTSDGSTRTVKRPPTSAHGSALASKVRPPA